MNILHIRMQTDLPQIGVLKVTSKTVPCWQQQQQPQHLRIVLRAVQEERVPRAGVLGCLQMGCLTGEKKKQKKSTNT